MRSGFCGRVMRQLCGPPCSCAVTPLQYGHTALPRARARCGGRELSGARLPYHNRFCSKFAGILQVFCRENSGNGCLVSVYLRIFCEGEGPKALRRRSRGEQAGLLVGATEQHWHWQKHRMFSSHYGQDLWPLGVYSGSPTGPWGLSKETLHTEGHLCNAHGNIWSLLSSSCA